MEKVEEYRAINLQNEKIKSENIIADKNRGTFLKSKNDFENQLHILEQNLENKLSSLQNLENNILQKRKIKILKFKIEKYFSENYQEIKNKFEILSNICEKK